MGLGCWGEGGESERDRPPPPPLQEGRDETRQHRHRRRTHLELTPSGARVYSRVVPMALKYERHLVSPLSRKDLAELDRLLRLLLGRAVELGPAHAE